MTKENIKKLMQGTKQEILDDFYGYLEDYETDYLGETTNQDELSYVVLRFLDTYMSHLENYINDEEEL